VRIIITNFGSAGDVQPYLALVMELRRHGHEVAFAFSPQFAPMIERHGVEFIPVGPDFQKTQYDIITTAVASPDIANSAGHIYDLFAPLVAALPQIFEELSEACRHADMLISGPLQPASRMIHELTGIPFVSIQEAHFGGGGTLAYQQATRALINPFREKHGLQPLHHPLTHDANSPQLGLYAISRYVLPPPPEWPRHYHMVGYFFFDDESFQPDPSLAQFIEAGEPPVVISFGSMVHHDPEAITNLLLAAIRRVGCRAIIQQGWSGLAKRNLPDSVHAAGFVPHSYLFSRAACVIHHGGGGTAAAAFRSGAPSVFVPHAADQPMWAQLVYEMGCSVAPLPFLELTADRLAEAIIMTLTDPRYAQAVAALGQKVRAEGGVKRASQLIGQLLSDLGLGLWDDGAALPNFDEAKERSEMINRRKQFQHEQRSRRKELSTPGSTEN
jgi:sterol 3beta-glucosyltransferase